MKNKTIHLVYLIFSLMIPLFTIVNYILDISDIKTCFYIINLNSIGINILLLKYAYLFWKVLSVILFILKVGLMTLLPILSTVKKYKKLYIIQFIIIFMDLFFIMTLPNNYFIIISNMLYHGFLLLLLLYILKKFE